MVLVGARVAVEACAFGMHRTARICDVVLVKADLSLGWYTPPELETFKMGHVDLLERGAGK